MVGAYGGLASLVGTGARCLKPYQWSAKKKPRGERGLGLAASLSGSSA